jgi:hypothetical protein
MPSPEHYMTTLSGVLESLHKKNYDTEFEMYPQGFGTGNGTFYQPEDLKIIRTYRFEGDTNPSDSSILYLIEAKNGLIGYNIDAYGVYSNHEDDGYADFIKRIPMEERDEQSIFA